MMMSLGVLRANHGRWIVDCPSATCAGALLFRGELTMRCDCRDDSVCDHEAVCGELIAVHIPDDVSEIDRLLELRPAKANRNWTPGETLRDLKRENVLNGVRI